MTDTDLFGVTIVEQPRFKVKGYAAPPGSGPKGEFCKTCKFMHRNRYHGKTYFKCVLAAKRTVRSKPGEPTRIGYSWSHCGASDIRANSPACSKWSMIDPVTWANE